MITINNVLSETTAIIFPGRVLILERSAQNKETHLWGTSDITKLSPNSSFVSILHLKITFHVALIGAAGGVTRAGGSFVSSLLPRAVLWMCSQDAPKFCQMQWIHSRSAGCFTGPPLHWSTCLWNWWRHMILIQIIKNISLYKHIQAAKQSEPFGDVRTFLTFPHINAGCGTILHWETNGLNNLPSSFVWLSSFC